MPTWDAAQYLKFERERTQPAVDLAQRIGLQAPARLLDVGCGPGNSTAVLRRRYPDAELLGIDSSPEMIAAARRAHPDLRFQLCDVREEITLPGPAFDVVFSNACLQWVPGHRALLPRLMALLRKGGVLAVQMPVNYDEPIHRILRGLAAADPWKEKLGAPRGMFVLGEEDYFDLLSEIAADFTLWRTTYFHRIASHTELMDWYRGSGLRPYLQALSPRDGAAFEKEVLARLKKAYPMQKNGEILLRFPRLFFTAAR